MVADCGTPTVELGKYLERCWIFKKFKHQLKIESCEEETEFVLLRLA